MTNYRLVGLVALMFILNGASSFGAELIDNGNFERDKLSGWQKQHAVKVAYGPFSESSNKKFGNYFVMFSAGDAPNGGEISQVIKTKPDGKYRVTFYVSRRGPGTGEQVMTVIAKNRSGQILKEYEVKVASKQGKPRKKDFEFVADGDEVTLIFKDTSEITASVDIGLDLISMIEK